MRPTESDSKPIVLNGKVDDPEYPLYTFLQSLRRTLGGKTNICQIFLHVMTNPIAASTLSSECMILEYVVKTFR